MKIKCKKFKYDSEKEARRGLLNNWKDSTQKFALKSFYYCSRCDGFHLTRYEANGGTNRI